MFATDSSIFHLLCSNFYLLNYFLALTIDGYPMQCRHYDSLLKSIAIASYWSRIHVCSISSIVYLDFCRQTFIPIHCMEGRHSGFCLGNNGMSLLEENWWPCPEINLAKNDTCLSECHGCFDTVVVLLCHRFVPFAEAEIIYCWGGTRVESFKSPPQKEILWDITAMPDWRWKYQSLL